MSNIFINPPNNNNTPVVTATRTTTTTETIVTPVSQSNNNNSSELTPPSYTSDRVNNHLLSWWDQGKEILKKTSTEAIGLFNQELRRDNIVNNFTTEIPIKDKEILGIFDSLLNKEPIDNIDLQKELNIFNNILLDNEEIKKIEIINAENLKRLSVLNNEIILNYEESELESISLLS